MLSNCSKNKENVEKSGLSLFKKHHEIYQMLDVTFSHFWVNKKLGVIFYFLPWIDLWKKYGQILKKKIK